MAIQFLRGTNAKIKSSTVVPKAGQPLYAIDTHELYVGDGATQAKDLTGIVGDATNTLKSDVSTLKSNVTTLQSNVTALQSDITTLQTTDAKLKSDISTLKSDVTELHSNVTTLQSNVTTSQSDITTLKATDAKLKAKQSTSNANNYILGGDLNWLKLPNNTIPTFEVNTSTGELVIKINGNDTTIQSSLSVSQTSPDTADVSGPVDSWGHVTTASYETLFTALGNSKTVLISDNSIDADLGNNMNMITDSEDQLGWVNIIVSKSASDVRTIMPNSLAVELYNSGNNDLVQYTTYGLLRDQALGLPTRYDLQMPIDNVYGSASDVVSNSGKVICVANWPSKLQYSDIESSVIATQLANIATSLTSSGLTVILSIYCANDETYKAIANDITSNTGLYGLVLDATNDVFSEINSTSDNLIILNPAHVNSTAIAFAQAIPTQLPDSALIFYDDSTNVFNKKVLETLSDFSGHGYNIYITQQLRDCYDKIISPTRPYSLVINDKTQFMNMLEADAFNKFDKIVLGAELALSMLRVTDRVNSFSQAVSDQLLSKHVCNSFLDKMQQLSISVAYNMQVKYVKGSEATTIPTTTTINKITVKQSKSY